MGILSNKAATGRKKRPSWFWLATEAGRAVTELGISIPFRSFYRSEFQGDGHPVLVMPGFMASDTSTGPLRNFIDRLGYSAYGWELGRNYARLQFLEALIAKVDELHEAHGQQVSLIGWSLGGVYARQVAKERPEKIRQVMTMASPFRGITRPNNATWIYNMLPGSKRVVQLNQDLLKDLPLPAPVPTTAIYTKEDGIVPWEACLEAEEDELHQNIQVRGSHLGLGVNLSVLTIVADRLQYRRENWDHFKAQNMFKDLLFYPSL
ncbi:MAG: alpha/beta hydrolase [Bacteroidota bacterium]